MLLAEEYKSLFSCTEEDKGNYPLSKSVLDPHCSCLGDAAGCHGACFCGGQRSHGRHPFQWSIYDTILIRLITHHFIQKHEAMLASRLGYLFNKQLATRFVGCRNMMCSRTRGCSRYIMASKLNGTTFLPYARTAYETSNNRAVYYFLIAWMSLIHLQIEFSLDKVLQEWKNPNLTQVVWVELPKAATLCLWTAYQCAQTLFMKQFEVALTPNNDIMPSFWLHKHKRPSTPKSEPSKVDGG